MGFKFWKKRTSTVIENHKLIMKEGKGGKKLERQQKKLAKMHGWKRKL